MKKGYKVALLVLLVLLIDQAAKFYIKLHFHYNEDVPMFGAEWARLHFVENEGMAFGITFDWEYGKLLLSLFRILMVFGLIYYTRLLIEAEAPMGFVYSVGLITAGAVGNILDSAFYGLIFTASGYHDGTAAQMTPFGQGYGANDPLGGFLHGKVVDMLHFPIIRDMPMPDWLPIWGGEECTFFSPIFNVADAAITIGVLCILLFQRRFFRDGMLHEEPAVVAQEAAMAASEGEDLQNDEPFLNETGGPDEPEDGEKTERSQDQLPSP